MATKTKRRNQRVDDVPCNCWIGGLVKLKRKLTNGGGESFKRGSLMVVVGTWRGTFSLADRVKGTLATAGKHRISQVHKRDLILELEKIA
jgi:hypothetical protein